MKITLYKGETCPKCKVIAMKLDKENIEYEVCSDVDEMIRRGIVSIPTLEVDGQRYNDVGECNAWIKKYMEANNGKH